MIDTSDGAEKPKDEDFIIVDNGYLDTIQEMHPLANHSDFTRVNPTTAQTDFKHLNSMISTFLIGPQFKQKNVQPLGKASTQQASQS